MFSDQSLFISSQSSLSQQVSRKSWSDFQVLLVCLEMNTLVAKQYAISTFASNTRLSNSSWPTT
jgi:hypothetical protein